MPNDKKIKTKTVEHSTANKFVAVPNPFRTIKKTPSGLPTRFYNEVPVKTTTTVFKDGTVKVKTNKRIDPNNPNVINNKRWMKG
jgi:hypothetical protein